MGYLWRLCTQRLVCEVCIRYTVSKVTKIPTHSPIWFSLVTAKVMAYTVCHIYGIWLTVYGVTLAESNSNRIGNCVGFTVIFDKVLTIKLGLDKA